MKKEDNALYRQIYSLPELIQDQYDYLEPVVRTLLTTEEIYSIKKVILTGCGDPHAAALAVKQAFEEYTHIPTEVMTAMELSRFYPTHEFEQLPGNPFIIAISDFGECSRVCEAAERAVKLGAFVLGITGKPYSRIAQLCTKLLPMKVPDFASAPGTRFYAADLIALLLLAVRIGEVRGLYSMDDAMEQRRDLRGMGGRLEESLAGIDEAAYSLAKRWRNLGAFDFIGSGPEYGTAWYCQAKVFEAIGKAAMYVDSEEWLHLNFIIRELDQTATVVFASVKSPAMSRNLELLKYIHQLGRPCVLITDGTAQDFETEIETIRVPSGKFSFGIVLTQFIPVNLMLGYMMDMLGEEDGRGCKGPWSFCKGGESVKNSEIIIVR